MRHTFASCVAAVLLAGCSKGGASSDILNNMAVENLTAENLVVENIAGVDPVAYRDHNYDFREGDAYGYIAAVSEEDQKRGKAAGDVLMFRYAGYWDGGYHLDELADDGSILLAAECSQPCVAIKTYRNGYVSRMAYTPESVIGAAFQDAMNGKLVSKQIQHAQPPASNETRAVENLTSENLVVESLVSENLLAVNSD